MWTSFITLVMLAFIFVATARAMSADQILVNLLIAVVVAVIIRLIDTQRLPPS